MAATCLVLAATCLPFGNWLRVLLSCCILLLRVLACGNVDAMPLQGLLLILKRKNAIPRNAFPTLPTDSLDIDSFAPHEFGQQGTTQKIQGRHCTLDFHICWKDGTSAHSGAEAIIEVQSAHGSPDTAQWQESGNTGANSCRYTNIKSIHCSATGLCGFLRIPLILLSKIASKRFLSGSPLSFCETIFPYMPPLLAHCGLSHCQDH